MSKLLEGSKCCCQWKVEVVYHVKKPDVPIGQLVMHK